LGERGGTADAPGLGPGGATRGGSNPPARTPSPSRTASSKAVLAPCRARMSGFTEQLRSRVRASLAYPEHLAAKGATSGVTWQVRTQDPERAEATAYQDGVWLGRTIVPVDTI